MIYNFFVSKIRLIIVLFVNLAAISLFASDALGASAQQTAARTGVSAIWVLANFSYAGMKAQGKSSIGWRTVSFICGLPGTLISFFLVREGSEVVFGVDLPCKSGAHKIKSGKQELMDALKDMPINETIACPKCRRTNNIDHAKCLYCSANLR